LQLAIWNNIFPINSLRYFENITIPFIYSSIEFDYLNNYSTGSENNLFSHLVFLTHLMFWNYQVPACAKMLKT
jgi:hypothetical protein